MQKWEYKIFASHLDPAELVVVLNDAGQEGWELIALAAVLDYHPPEVLDPIVASEGPGTETDGDLVPVEAFRYLFKRPLD